jgi:hypothetical protein
MAFFMARSQMLLSNVKGAPGAVACATWFSHRQAPIPQPIDPDAQSVEERLVGVPRTVASLAPAGSESARSTAVLRPHPHASSLPGTVAAMTSAIAVAHARAATVARSPAHALPLPGTVAATSTAVTVAHARAASIARALPETLPRSAQWALLRTSLRHAGRVLGRRFFGPRRRGCCQRHRNHC